MYMPSHDDTVKLKIYRKIQLVYIYKNIACKDILI